MNRVPWALFRLELVPIDRIQKWLGGRHAGVFLDNRKDRTALKLGFAMSRVGKSLTSTSEAARQHRWGDAVRERAAVAESTGATSNWAQNRGGQRKLTSRWRVVSSGGAIVSIWNLGGLYLKPSSMVSYG